MKLLKYGNIGLALAFIIIFYFVFIKHPLINKIEVIKLNIDEKTLLLREENRMEREAGALAEKAENAAYKAKELANKYPGGLNIQICLDKIISLAGRHELAVDIAEADRTNILDIKSGRNYGGDINENEEVVNEATEVPSVNVNFTLDGAGLDNISRFLEALEGINWPYYIHSLRISRTGEKTLSCSIEISFVVWDMSKENLETYHTIEPAGNTDPFINQAGAAE